MKSDKLFLRSILLTKRLYGIYRSAELDAVLECSHEVSVRQFDDVQVVRLLHVLHPLVGLTLRIDHQRPPTGVTTKRSNVALTCVSFLVNCNNNDLKLVILSVGHVLSFLLLSGHR